MKLLFKRMILTAGMAVLLPLTAHADMPGRHPAYLHALTDLRTARWMIAHRPGDAAVSSQEDIAITEIDRAIGEIKHAAYDDGKDLNDHPQVDAAMDQPGRLHQAAELLAKVHNDINREEDDPMTRDLKHRSLMHVDQAQAAVDHAIADVHYAR